MAHLNKNNFIVGRIGNLVYKEFNGKQIIQSRPEEVKQTKNTKRSSSEFIRCSKWAKRLRISLIPFLLGLTDSFMYKRFTGQMYLALLSNKNSIKEERTPFNADMSALNGFDFNSHSPFKAYFLPEISCEVNALNQVKVMLPAMNAKTDLVYASSCYQAELIVCVLAANFVLGSALVEHHFIVPLDSSDPIQAETNWTSPALPENYFVMVSAKLLFFNNNVYSGKNYVNTKGLNPAMVVLASKTV